MKYIFLLLACSLFRLHAQTGQSYLSVGQKPYNLLHSTMLKKPSAVKPVLIAVIDDAFSLSHTRLSGYYYTNGKEIRNNLKDDDLNGFTDDTQGWDLADGDNKVSLPDKKAAIENFLHGSMIAGIVIRTAELTLGKAAAQKNIRILPIKVIPDKAAIGNYENGYEGIRYAISMGADIICLPWSGGRFDEKYLPLFEQAKAKGILILASAGNFYSEEIPYPASLPGVYAVAAVDTNFVKMPSSNYGTAVSLSAVGLNVLAPYALNDSLYTYCEKTSAAVALVTGCAAVLKTIDPKLTADQIMTILQNTATGTDLFNPQYTGKLGSGVPHMEHAVSYVLAEKKLSSHFDPQRSKGALVVSKREEQKEWEIRSSSATNEVVFSLVGDSRKLTSQYVSFLDARGTIINKLSLADFAETIRIKGDYIKIAIEGRLPKVPVQIQYHTITVDSTALYCKETVEYTSNEGFFDDGSSGNAYANNSSCKWQISVENGKNIRLDFSEFDLEDIKDNLMIFKGNSMLQENLMARFTGNQLPPSLVIDGSQVLIWFLSDKQIQGKGWKLHYHAVDDKPGIVSQ